MFPLFIYPYICIITRFQEYNIKELSPEVKSTWQRGINYLKSRGAEIVDVSLPLTKGIYIWAYLHIDVHVCMEDKRDIYMYICIVYIHEMYIYTYISV